jgi:TonB family protein
MRRAGANATLGFVVASLWFHGVAAVVVTAMPKLEQAPINGEIAMPRAAPSIELELTPPPSPTPSATSDASAAEDAAATPQTPQTEQERERERERERQRELEREREREQERQRLRFVTPTMAPAPPPPPPPPPPQQALGRQSVQQSQSNDQQANDARFLAEGNNNVAEETVAAVRGTQEDSNNPQHAAAERRAPGQGAGAEDIHDGRRNREGEILAQQEQRLGGRRTPPTSAQAANEPQGAVATQGGAAAGTQGASAGATAPSIEAPTPNRVFAASEGVWGQFSLTQQQRTGVAPRPNQGAAGQGGQNGAGGSGGLRSQVAGRGAEGVVAAFSPASTDYARAFGSQVEQERRLARERRTEARGESPTESWQQLRQGMENYVQAVRVGNQTALRTAASPFATYLSNMHHRIHRLFADGFLAGLEAGSAENPLNDMNLRSTVEIVLERDGRVSRIGIVRTSGSTMFDVAAMNSVRRSAPFGDAPEAIRSADGKVYIHWGFYRNERQCGTFNAEPFVLSGPTASGTRERTTIIVPRAGRDR